MEYLPIEFYRLFSGLKDRLLVVGDEHYSNELKFVRGDFLQYSTVDMDDYEYYTNVKPCLVPFQDLTDEQILNITSEFTEPLNGLCKIKRTENFVTIERVAGEDEFDTHDVFFSLSLITGKIKCKFYIDYQLLLNRMYKEHSHPLADYYIKENLALRKD